MPAPFIYSFTKIGEGVIRPFVPVLIENPFTGESKTIWALLDTGADANCFPAHIATGTGHDLKHADAHTSVSTGVEGSNVQTWKHTFKISLLDPKTLKPVWTTKRILVDCVDHNNMPPLLGTVGFLSELKITFNYKTSKIIVEVP